VKRVQLYWLYHPWMVPELGRREGDLCSIFDFKKTFDRVPQRPLGTKLYNRWVFLTMLHARAVAQWHNWLLHVAQSAGWTGLSTGESGYSRHPHHPRPTCPTQLDWDSTVSVQSDHDFSYGSNSHHCMHILNLTLLSMWKKVCGLW